MPEKSTGVTNRPPQVDIALIHLEQLCESFAVQVNGLEDRLSRVRGSKPRDPSKEGLEQPPLVPMAERIEKSVSFLSSLCRRLEELHADLEI